MAKFEYKPDEVSPSIKKRDRYDSSHCEVFGCPSAGHIFTNNWNCRYHHGKSGASLARITLVLKTHTGEISWYERLLNMNAVDFAMGDVKKNAPGGLEVQQKEDWKEYRARIFLHIDNLLGITHEGERHGKSIHD